MRYAGTSSDSVATSTYVRASQYEISQRCQHSQQAKPIHSPRPDDKTERAAPAQPRTHLGDVADRVM